MSSHRPDAPSPGDVTGAFEPDAKGEAVGDATGAFTTPAAEEGPVGPDEGTDVIEDQTGAYAPSGAKAGAAPLSRTATCLEETLPGPSVSPEAKAPAGDSTCDLRPEPAPFDSSATAAFGPGGANPPVDPFRTVGVEPEQAPAGRRGGKTG